MGERAERALIVVPTYNEAANLTTLVTQVLEQDPRLEILVVDDNSPDGTGVIADETARTNPRVHTMHRAGKLGLGTAYIAVGPSAYDQANEHLRQALEQAEGLRMRPLLIACYFWLSVLARRQGDVVRGADFLATARALAHEIGLTFLWDRLAPA